MRYIKTPIFLALAVLILFGGACAFALEEKAELRVDTALVKAPEADAPQVLKLPRGTKVNVLGFENGYYQVEVNGEEGFVVENSIKIQQSVVKMETSGTIEADDVKLRSKPDTEASIVTKLKKGTVVQVSEKSGNWYKVSDGKQQGYVHVDYISVTQSEKDAYYVELKMGMSGSAVLSLQNALKERGYYNGKCNGEYGAKTREAVSKFQEANGLNPNGIATEKTQELLFGQSS